MTNVTSLETKGNYTPKQMAIKLLEEADKMRSLAVVIEWSEEEDGTPIPDDETGPVQAGWTSGDWNKFYAMFSIGVDKIMGLMRKERRCELEEI